MLTGAHRIVSLAKRWLLGTHQVSVEERHLQGCLNEPVLHFDRRRSRSRGLVFYQMLEIAVAHDPKHHRRQARTATRWSHTRG